MFGRGKGDQESSDRVTRLFPRDEKASPDGPAAPGVKPAPARLVTAPPRVAAPLIPPNAAAAPADPEPAAPPAPPPAPPADPNVKDEKYWAQLNADREKLRAQRTPEMKGAIERAKQIALPIVREKIDPARARRMPRGQLAGEIKDIATALIEEAKIDLDELAGRDVVTFLINDVLGQAKPISGAGAGLAGAVPVARGVTAQTSQAPAPPPGQATIEDAKRQVQPLLLERIDVQTAIKLPRGELAAQIGELSAEILGELKIRLNGAEHRDLVTMLINDMLGLGPIEPLLSDETITDIMVNGPKQVYIERRGKLELTHVQFRDDAHVMNVAMRIVTQVGRRIDESTPLVDARLMDGSRVNIIIPPLAIDGPSISIRKFSKKSITLDVMAKQHNISPAMATVLKIASRSRLNILISGGTGSGKTTLLNAMSQMIDHGERTVTIEDAAELQLQQPHVVRLETRPANLEGHGEITMRDLLKNSLRMRPDRIILGEVRGAEAVDMLQAMNTGHEGSMCTVHANRPREALTRLENMVGLAGINLPAKAVRTQIAAAIDMIVQVSRMRDGIRRVVSIMEVVGMEGDVITTQELFTYHFEGENPDGTLRGSYKPTGLRPHFTPKAEYFGLDRQLVESTA
jgi:pilus assembly protein CpaF